MQNRATVGSLAISFFLNDRDLRTTVAPDMTALELLRDGLGLTGTKESCGEGDCGSCTVALGQLEAGRLVYRAVNACLLPAARLHGRHIVTSEGLAVGEKLHLIQKLILDHHATQCGWCTPGMVMSLFCLFARERRPKDADLLQALEGNLCRCTGYETIRQAGRAAAEAVGRDLNRWRELVFPAYVPEIEAMMKTFSERISRREESRFSGRRTAGYHLPHESDELFGVWAGIGHDRCRLLAGGTDLLVAMNSRREFPLHLIDISAVQGLDFIEEKGGFLRIGAACTLARITESALVREKIPALAAAVRQMGSAQIRNTATLCGNVANASPVADGAVALLGLAARLVLRSRRGERTAPLEEFYRAYKKTCLKPGELIAAVEVPPPRGSASFIKSGKRVAVDISSVNSFCHLQADEGLVFDCRIACGGVAVFPKLAAGCAAFLAGRELSPETVEVAGRIAAGEFIPISDIRGSAQFRRILIRNQVTSHLSRCLPGGGCEA